MSSPLKPVPMQTAATAPNSVPMIESQDSNNPSSTSAVATASQSAWQVSSSTALTNAVATAILPQPTTMDTGAAQNTTAAPAIVPTQQPQVPVQQAQQIQEQALETEAQKCRTALVAWANAEIANASNKVQVKSDVFNAIANVHTVTYYARSIFHHDNSLLSPVVVRIGELYSRIFDASKITAGQWEPLQAAVVELNKEVDQYNLAGLRSYRLFAGTQLTKLSPVVIPANVQSAIQEYKAQQEAARQAAEAEARRVREAQIKVLEDEITAASIQLLGIANNDPYFVPHITQQTYEATTKFFAAQQAKVRDQLKGPMPDSIGQRFAQLSKLLEAANLFLRRQPIDLEIDLLEDNRFFSKDAVSFYKALAHFMYVLGSSDTSQFLTRVNSKAIVPKANNKYEWQELRAIVLTAINEKINSDSKLQVFLLLSMLNANASFAEAKAKLEEKAITQYAGKVDQFTKFFKKFDLSSDRDSLTIISNIEKTGSNVKVYGPEISRKFPIVVDCIFDALINRIGYAMVELTSLAKSAKTCPEAATLTPFFDQVDLMIKSHESLKKSHKQLAQSPNKDSVYAQAKSLADSIVALVNNFKTCSKLVSTMADKHAWKTLKLMNEFVTEVLPIAFSLRTLSERNKSYKPYRSNEIMSPEGYFAGLHTEHGNDETICLAELFMITSHFFVRPVFVKDTQPLDTILAGAYLPDRTVQMLLPIDDKGIIRVRLPAVPKQQTSLTAQAPSTTASLSTERKQAILETIREDRMDVAEPGTPELIGEEAALELGFVASTSASTSCASTGVASSSAFVQASSMGSFLTSAAQTMAATSSVRT